jgi:hypothetical protein
VETMLFYILHICNRRIWFIAKNHPLICLFIAAWGVWRLSPLPVTGFMALISEGSFTCHTCFETGTLFIRSHPWNWHPRPTVEFELATYLRIIRSLRRRYNHCATSNTINEESYIREKEWNGRKMEIYTGTANFHFTLFSEKYSYSHMQS